MSVVGSATRGGARRWIVWTGLAMALGVPSGIAFQEATGPAPKVGDYKLNPKDGLRYVWVPPGNFTAGCSPGDKECYEDETPTRKITLTRGFWLGQTEVTQAAFRKIMDYNNSVFEG